MCCAAVTSYERSETQSLAHPEIYSNGVSPFSLDQLAGLSSPHSQHSASFGRDGTAKRSSAMLRADLAAGGQTWNVGPPSNASTSDVIELLPAASRELLYAPNAGLGEQYLGVGVHSTPELLCMNMNSREILDLTAAPSPQELLTGRERELRWADVVAARARAAAAAEGEDATEAFLLASPGTGTCAHLRTPSHQLYANQNATQSAAAGFPNGPLMAYTRFQPLTSTFAAAPSTPAALVRYMSVPSRDLADPADTYTDQQIHIVSGAGV